MPLFLGEYGALLGLVPGSCCRRARGGQLAALQALRTVRVRTTRTGGLAYH